MEWKEIKNPYEKLQSGYYVILVCRKVHICFHEHRNWDRPWHIPDEWKDPTHYIKLDDIKDIWINEFNACSMD